MNELAKKLLQEKRDKAIEMVGKKLDVEVTGKAISIDEKNFTATFVMSTSSIDRHGDIVDQNTWNLSYFKENPYFALQHRSDEFPIGKWISVGLENDPNNAGQQRLVGVAKFNTKYEDGARAFDHVMEGEMNMVSVGFIPRRVEYDEVKDAFVLYECELIECSLVGIGSNRQALVKTVDEVVEVKEAETIKEKIIKVANELDKEIKVSNTATINQLRARDLLFKAIHKM